MESTGCKGHDTPELLNPWQHASHLRDVKALRAQATLRPMTAESPGEGLRHYNFSSSPSDSILGF